MTTAVLRNTSTRTALRTSAGHVPRWMLVAGAVALIGVSIDLFRGPPANALPAPTAQIHAVHSPLLDHSVAAKLADHSPLEPGASIAAYDTPALEVPARAAAAPAPMADDPLEPGASVAAYER